MSGTEFRCYASVVLELAIDKSLTYGVPAMWASLIRPGMKVEVPVRGTLRTGYVLSLASTSEFKNVKPIASLASNDALISPELFKLAEWMSKYYASPWSAVLKTILPASVRKDTKPKQQFFVRREKSREEIRDLCVALRNTHPPQAAILDEMLQATKGLLLTELLEQAGVTRSPVDTLVKKGILSIDNLAIDRSPFKDADYLRTKPKKLNDEQQTTLDKITLSLREARYEAHLLFGVTGSGKTEVYLQAIDAALALGKGTIMLVPEIALTTQTIERFRSRFEGSIAILHHRLSTGERFDEWNRVRRGDAKIVIGARSAIFSPVQNLGLILVDEEHENSYKQNDDGPCYHARDIAVMRGKMGNATVVMGSATPSLESYYNVQQGKYTLSELNSRADAASIPQVTIVDMRHEYDKAKNITLFSEKLLTEIKKRFEIGEQSLLFLNRRGFHSTLLCQGCQTAVKCNHCDVSLTFHKSRNALTCHLCGFTLSPPPKECPSCHQPSTLKFKGSGTEQVERALGAIFPDIRTIRIDADTTRHKGSHETLFRDFKRGKADVLIGTQMIAKGLHFPQVTLVGILNTDSALNIPDFRASETVFQLITQVAGRSGRGVLQGEVIIQTAMPDNSTIQHASKQDFQGFFKEEIAAREMFQYPPFTRMAKIRFWGPDLEKTEKFANKFHKELVKQLKTPFELHPVMPAGHAKVKDRFYLQFLARGKSIYDFNTAVDAVKHLLPIPSSIHMLVDIDPMSTYF